MRVDVDRLLDDVSGKYAEPFRRVLSEWVIAQTLGDVDRERSAREDFANVQRETVFVCWIVGSTLALQNAARVLGEDGTRFGASRQLLTFADSPMQRILPAVTFEEAVADMLRRTPVTLRDAAQRTAENVARLYSRGVNVAFVRAAEEAVTDKVQSMIARSIDIGIPEARAGRYISEAVERIREESDAWSEAYAKMVFRTNANTAATAGQFAQVLDPDVAEVIPCLQLRTSRDGDTRKNHLAGDGVILRSDNPAWGTIAPPLGYNCRCKVGMISIVTLRRMGYVEPDGSILEDYIPDDCFPDPGFRHGGRPDLYIAA